jgi:hypothetical protein
MVSNIFSLTLHTKLGFPHPTIHGFSQCIYSQTIDPRRIHLLCCVHGGERTTTHDVDLTHVDLVFGIASSQKVAMTITAQAKVMSYRDRHFEDDFISLIIEIFGYLHQQVNDFLHQCANMAWLTKGSRGPLLLIICSFYRQRLSLAF